MANTIFKTNKGILNKQRFALLEKQRMEYLRALSPQKSIKMMERLLDSGILHEFRRIQKQLSDEGK